MEFVIFKLLFLVSFMLLSSKSSLVNLNNITGSGFTLKLIRREFIHPQFYPANLTTTSESSHRRSMAASVRPALRLIGASYVVPLRIGKLKQNLVMDTASSLVWTQCCSCNPCFPQKGTKYDPTKSSTHRLLPPDHPFCDHRGRRYEKCPYFLKYVRARTEGFLGWEKFHFDAGRPSIPIIVGCSTATYGDIFPGNDEIDGILGMGRGPESFPMQVAMQTIQRKKFAYCLTKLGSSDHGYLRFGNDIKLKKHAHEAPLIDTDEKYYVDLVDIGIQGKRLNLHKDMFKIKADGDGGCFLDAGSPLMHLIKPAYDVLKAKLIVYFKGHNISQLGEQMPPFDLCFQTRRSFHQYPFMDLHFPSSYFRLPYANLFHFFMGKFCLAVVPSNIFSIIGSFQQAGHQIFFDLPREKVIFSDDDC